MLGSPRLLDLEQWKGRYCCRGKHSKSDQNNKRSHGPLLTPSHKKKEQCSCFHSHNPTIIRVRTSMRRTMSDLQLEIHQVHYRHTFLAFHYCDTEEEAFLTLWISFPVCFQKSAGASNQKKRSTVMDHYLDDVGLGEKELKRRKRIARAASLPDEDKGLVYWEVRKNSPLKKTTSKVALAHPNLTTCILLFFFQ